MEKDWQNFISHWRQQSCQSISFLMSKVSYLNTPQTHLNNLRTALVWFKRNPNLQDYLLHVSLTQKHQAPGWPLSPERLILSIAMSEVSEFWYSPALCWFTCMQESHQTEGKHHQERLAFNKRAANQTAGNRQTGWQVSCVWEKSQFNLIGLTGFIDLISNTAAKPDRHRNKSEKNKT